MNPDFPTLPAPATPPPRPPKRSGQPAGEHFDSPQRRRRWRKDSELVVRPELPLLEQQLSTDLESLLKTYDRSRRHEADSEPFLPINYADGDIVMQSPNAGPSLERPLPDPRSDSPCPDPQSERNTRRVLPDETANRVYANWLHVIPGLVSDYLGYMQRAQGRLGGTPGVEAYLCPKGLCKLETCEVLCLHFDRMSCQLLLWIPLIAGS